jgi:hypothetical protein
MTKTLASNTSNQTIAQLDYYRNKNLSFVLGYTNKTNNIENSIDSYADSISNSSVAFRILDSEIKTCLDHETLFGGNKYWTRGCVPGKWKSSGDTNRQYLFEQEGILFMVVGFSGNKNRTDLEGSIISREMFTDISGKIATAGGIEYCAVNALPNTFDTLSGKYTWVSLPQEEFVDKLNNSTSLLTRASNLCGSGNETSVGTCCLYHKEAGYDSVAGVTYSAGDFYKCDCTKCYRCLELAEAFNMNYIFTHGTGGTGSSCLSCDSETIPTNCGPCACSIDWNDRSFYSQILSNQNISSVSSTSRNATIITNNESMSGSILSIDIDLSGLSPEDKILESAYDTNASEKTLYVPLIGSCGEEALVRVSVVRDGVTRKWSINGIESPLIRGKNYTSVSVDDTRWSNMFPNISASRISINIVPIGGFALNLGNILPLSLIIHKTIRSDDISDTTEAKEFNFFSISKLKDENGGSIYSGYAQEQSNIKNLVPEYIATGPSSFAPSQLPKAKEVITNNSEFTTTTLEEIVSVDSEDLKTNNTASINIQTAFVDERVGIIFMGEDDTPWTINSINSRAYGSTLQPYDATKTELIYRNSTTINLDNNPSNVKTFAFELKIGSGCQSISGE